MAIRKDIDDMLNNLKSGKPLDMPKNPENPKELSRPDPKIDNMSVDDLLSSLTSGKTASDNAEKSSPTKPKKKIVITGELPDYEALRAEEKQRERLELERAEAEAKAKQVELQRQRAEKEAAEKAEKERIKAEREAEKARIEAEKKAAAEAAEKARIEAEKKAAAEAAEKARIEAEKKAAAEAAEKARVEAEKKAAAEAAEKARIEAEKKAAGFDEEAVAVSSSAVDESDNSSDSTEADRQNDNENNTAPENHEIAATPEKKRSGKLTAALENILDENPDDIINQRKEQPEEDDSPRKGGFKKGFYAVSGVVFAILACIGLVAVIAKGISMFGSYSSGDSRKDSFAETLYPAVIMDIESFNSPAELPPEQVITAAIWSMIMTEGVTDQYELTFDVVMIPAADVESYAVKLFGDDIPALTHTTVGPAESRFYYNEETKSYSVPIAPVTYTYAPEIREATKNGNEYTIVVDYIDELPEWLPKTSSKSVEFKVVESNGSYLIRSMRILVTNTNAV